MKLLVAGSRSITDYRIIKNAIEISIFSFGQPSTIISGCARGVDKLGEKWAKENNIAVERHPALWDTYGKKAGYIRNKEMVDACDGAVIIWDGRSKGTKHTIDLLKNSNKPYIVIIFIE